jgi:hypothetical protein
MPGLLRGVARTAVVAGTATTVSNRVSRRQAQKWSAQDTQSQPDPRAGYAQAPPPAPARDDSIDVERLSELARLHDQGALTDAEFTSAKARILGT